MFEPNPTIIDPSQENPVSTETQSMNCEQPQKIPQQTEWSLDSIHDLHGFVSTDDLLSSVATTVSHTFSDMEQSPLLEDLDLHEGASNWTSLFDAPARPQQHQHQGTLPPPPDVYPNLYPQQPIDPNFQVPITHTSAAAEARMAMHPVDEDPPVTFAKAFEQEVEQRIRTRRVKLCPRGPSANKTDDLGITVYNRKPRSQPLAPVEIPESATGTVAKRARNTEAARRSRARKMERMQQLEDRLRELVQRNDFLQREVERLRKKCGEE